MQGEGSYLNIHHTVKTDVVPNIKATLFFLIGDLIRIRFLNIVFELDFRFDIYIGLDIRFLFLLDIWFTFYYFYLFGLDIWFILSTIEIDLYISSNLKAG